MNLELVVRPAGNRWWWAVLIDGVAHRQGYAKSESAAQRRLDEVSVLYNARRDSDGWSEQDQLDLEAQSAE